VWIAQAVFDTNNGNVAAAKRDLAQARRLNPHATILAPKPKAG
jgi:hypothetical protein